MKAAPSRGGQSRIFAVRPRVDDRICRIVVDVEHRRIRDVDPESPSFERRQPSLLVSQHRVAGCANRHFRREDHCAAQVDRVRDEIPAPRPESRAGLEIGPENQRNRAHLLHRVELGARLRVGEPTEIVKPPTLSLLMYCLSRCH